MVDHKVTTILVVDDDEDILRFLRVVFLNEGYTVVTASSAEEALKLVQTQIPDLVILDVMLPKMDGYSLCRRLRTTPSTRLAPVLMLTAKGELADKIAGFEAGADDYVVKPIEKEELRYRVRNLLARGTSATVKESEPQARGHICVVYGLKGGVGKTTVAVNLAIALTKLATGKVALFDADFSFGEIALQLNLPPVRSIIDVIRDVREIEGEMVSQVLMRHESGISALLCPVRPEQADLITPEHVGKIVSLIAASHDYVVVDCPTSYDERTLTMLGHADIVLLIATPEIAALKNTHTFLEMADQLGVSKDKILLVLNRANTNVGIAAAEIERTFKHPVLWQIPSTGRTISLSTNRGEPLALTQPNHPVSQQCMKMAEYCVKLWKGE